MIDKEIEHINKVILKFNEQSNYKTYTKSEKITFYFRKLLENSLKESNKNSVSSLLKKLFELNHEFFHFYGDDILESLWQLYESEENLFFDNNSYLNDLHVNATNEEDVVFDFKLKSKELFEREIRMFLQTQTEIKNKKKVDDKLSDLINSNVISIVIKDVSNSNSNSNNQEEGNFNNIYNEEEDTRVNNLYKIHFLSKDNLIKYINNRNDISNNFLIDILILLIFSRSKLNEFYTSLSTFLVTTQGNSYLLFKIISLFSICLLNLNKKENFLNSLLFIIGSSFRDHAKSYLKSKNMLNETITYHKCSKNHNESEHSFSEVKILSTIQCEYIERNLLNVLSLFVICIIKDFQYTEKWENYKEVFYKYLDCNQEIDVEENINGELTCLYYLILFFSDFIFFFISNFMEYDNKDKRFLTKFSFYNEFTSLILSIFNMTTNNIIELFNFSKIKRRFLDLDCEKTNYSISDHPNHYGLCLIFYLYFIENRNPLVLINSNRNHSFISLIFSNSFLAEFFIQIIYDILYYENRYMNDGKTNKIFIRNYDLCLFNLFNYSKNTIPYIKNIELSNKLVDLISSSQQNICFRKELEELIKK